MLKKNIHRKIGLYDESLRSKSDREMWARILNHGYKMSYVEDYVSLYRRHNKQMHRSPEKLKINDKLQNHVLRLIEKGFYLWIQAHTEEGWIREHDPEFLYGTGTLGTGFYSADIREELKEEILRKFISEPRIFYNIYEKEGNFSFYQIFYKQTFSTTNINQFLSTFNSI